ncbi:MAG: flavin reductase [Rhodobacteraceae bacterium]|jgi:flavin reductase (DIM6/NTAB) family NADH-FMN oxidoreductase RutF|uniref:Conserved protein of DIM6/NTAB family n=1 Tax=Salipiger profundus TaxID=1229727 RepID=A0A1U7D293_9RHOB|nr:MULTISPECIES: flavin reductase family protein [Salipiger]APX22269.1 conserved protein of DIM6/NTAB family [Salipiger profundus]MAB05263.1 flavin reductase [Paracoccaceae bacterium]GGA29929.1 flavin oxidoreductase [Salipiger profundus]SFD91929.1 NADH-FMN oxidoreductase RutF, flavin reductase (DIM6/NTAB) family [Salipiger profundus]
MSDLPASFDPATADPKAFRDALGRFVTGVTVVTCATPDGPLGITANSFASLSLDPPLVLWSPAKGSQRYPFFVAAEYFAIHVLGREQSALCRDFARSGDAFDEVPWQEGPHRVPLLEGCLSRFLCKRVADHDGGDHSIVVGEVLQVDTHPGEPLLFRGGGFGAFTPDP